MALEVCIHNHPVPHILVCLFMWCPEGSWPNPSTLKTCQIHANWIFHKGRIREPHNFLKGNGWVDEGSMGLDPYCRWVSTLNTP